MITQPPFAPSDPASPRVGRARVTGSGDYVTRAREDRDDVVLRAGELIVDARATRPVRVSAGAAHVVVRDARVAIASHGGSISQVSVFAGSVEVIAGGRTTVIDAGETWSLPAASPAGRVPGKTMGTGAFREGWAALREGRHADAIAAFDRAADEAVAEDAMYWSAVAAERSGDREDAGRRYRRVIELFPESPRAADAATALARSRSDD